MNDHYAIIRESLSKKIGIGILSIILMCLCTSSWALSVRPIAFNDLVKSADLIVYGTVQSQEIQALYPNRPQLLFTLSTIKVGECWKGECGDQVVISQIGGKKGPFAVSIPGAPLLQNQSQIVVFLHKKKQVSSEYTHYVVVGLSQGRYTVEIKDEKAWITHSDSTPHPDHKEHPHISDRKEPIALADFKMSILKHLKSEQPTSVLPKDPSDSRSELPSSASSSPLVNP